MDGVSDELLLELAEKIGYASNVRILALKLGFTLSDSDTFVETNKLNGRVTSEGTLQMLRRWRDKTPTSNQRNVLKTALENAQLSELADIHFNQARTNGGQREEYTRKRFRSELSDTTEEKDAILTEEASFLPFLFLSAASSETAEILSASASSETLAEILSASASSETSASASETLAKILSASAETVEIAYLRKILERRYTDPERFVDNITLQKKDYRPSLTLRNGHHDSSPFILGNSRHDIFTAQLPRKQLRRIVVSHSSPEKSTALCHSLAYDWATQNQSSCLSDMQFLFQLSYSKIKPNQTFEAAIKDQLFSEYDLIDETLIKESIEKMPDGVTILLDGYNGNNAMEDILTGRTLKEVTVMVTAEPRSANMLHRMAPGVYDHIDMY